MIAVINTFLRGLCFVRDCFNSLVVDARNAGGGFEWALPFVIAGCRLFGVLRVTCS